MSNPRAAVDSIIARGETVGRIHLSEVTFVKVAILEKIGSPITSGEMKDVGLQDLFQTLFVLAHEPGDSVQMLQEGCLLQKSLEWAQSIPVNHYKKIMDALRRITQRLEAVAPQGIPEGTGGKKKLQTGG